MKTKDLLASKRREEKTVEFFAAFSLISAPIGLIFGILFMITNNSLCEMIAVIVLTAFILPFVLLQFFMSAGINPQYGFG